MDISHPSSIADTKLLLLPTLRRVCAGPCFTDWNAPAHMSTGAACREPCKAQSAGETRTTLHPGGLMEIKAIEISDFKP